MVEAKACKQRSIKDAFYFVHAVEPYIDLLKGSE